MPTALVSVSPFREKDTGRGCLRNRWRKIVWEAPDYDLVKAELKNLFPDGPIFVEWGINFRRA